MASELRVNTLKDASGNNSIATSIVAGGSAKSWIHFTGSNATSTPNTEGINASLNITSLADVASGRYTIAFSSAFTGINYALGSVGYRGSTLGNALQVDDDPAATPSAVTVESVRTSDGALSDKPQCGFTAHGDLA